MNAREALNQLKKKFVNNLKTKIFDNKHSSHCGSEGHFIEKCLGLEHNSKNEPDFMGWEIKKKSNKISFGDWSASGYLFKQDELMKRVNKINTNITRDEYMKLFGSYNHKKQRYAWSGKCIPKVDKWNYNGTIMKCENGNIYIFYNYMKDTRKLDIPDIYQNKYIILQYWKYSDLKKRLENKFNKNGFVVFEKNIDNQYNKMLICKTIEYITFYNMFKSGKIIFDSGMYQGNNRNYSQFRANWKIIQELIFEEYTG